LRKQKKLEQQAAKQAKMQNKGAEAKQEKNQDNKPPP
jgi:hypothetical protein